MSNIRRMQDTPDAIRNLLLRKKNSQIVLGITGGSGCGKTTIAEILKQRLDSSSLEVVHLDKFFFPVADMPTYYSDYLGKDQPNYNSPDAMDFASMVEYCAKVTDYDIVILEGHFALYKQEMRDLMDIKCFIEIDEEEMLERRTVRNLRNNYGGDEANIRHYNRECVLPMYRKHILPTRNYADIIIPNSKNEMTKRDVIIECLCEELFVAGR